MDEIKGIKKNKEISEAKIRKRQSYTYFKEIYEAILNKHPFEVLRLIHRIIDNYRGFHSQYNSDCALESINLLEEDIKGKPNKLCSGD